METAQVHEDTSHAPFTGTESLLYDWKIEYHSPSRRGTDRKLLKSGETRHLFLLRYETGTAPIDLDGVNPDLQTTTTIEVGSDVLPPPPVKKFLEATGEIDREHNRERRCCESRSDPGADVHVRGPFATRIPRSMTQCPSTRSLGSRRSLLDYRPDRI